MNWSDLFRPRSIPKSCRVSKPMSWLDGLTFRPSILSWSQDAVFFDWSSCADSSIGSTQYPVPRIARVTYLFWEQLHGKSPSHEYESPCQWHIFHEHISTSFARTLVEASSWLFRHLHHRRCKESLGLPLFSSPLSLCCESHPKTSSDSFDWQAYN